MRDCSSATVEITTHTRQLTGICAHVLAGSDAASKTLVLHTSLRATDRMRCPSKGCTGSPARMHILFIEICKIPSFK